MTYLKVLNETPGKRKRLKGLFFYFYYLSMKSLVKSLLDNETSQMTESLFDKDLVEKDLPRFGDLYDVGRIETQCVSYGSNGPEFTHNKVMENFDYVKLKRDIKPVDLKNVPGYNNETLEELQYIIPLINKILISKEESRSWKAFSEIFKDEIKDVFKKYKKAGRWTNNRAFATMFVNVDGCPYLRLGVSHPGPFVWIEIYFCEK